jgi:hypothetical protein
MSLKTRVFSKVIRWKLYRKGTVAREPGLATIDVDEHSGVFVDSEESSGEDTSSNAQPKCLKWYTIVIVNQKKGKTPKYV